MSKVVKSTAPTATVPAAPAEAWNFELVRLKPGADAHQTALALGAKLRQAHLPVRVEEWREAAGGSAVYVQWIQLLLLAGLVILALVGAGSLVNAMTGVVVERTVEVGTLRALGATKAQVFGLFCLEALFVVGAAFTGAFVLTEGAKAVFDHVDLSVSNAVFGQLFGSRSVRLDLGWATLAANAGAVVALALGGTWVPLRGILKLRVIAALERVPE